MTGAGFSSGSSATDTGVATVSVGTVGVRGSPGTSGAGATGSLDTDSKEEGSKRLSTASSLLPDPPQLTKINVTENDPSAFLHREENIFIYRKIDRVLESVMP